jgi:hypothetical protein
VKGLTQLFDSTQWGQAKKPDPLLTPTKQLNLTNKCQLTALFVQSKTADFSIAVF